MNRFSENVKKKAEDFIENETQFHLGFLPTEQSNPKTKNMDVVFQNDLEAGVRLLQSVDRDIIPMARKVLSSEPFNQFAAAVATAVGNGNKIVFSGCGSTGRLSIMLENSWRSFWNEQDPSGKRSDQVASIMTGGDYALVKAVEFFEDHLEFGRQQVRETGMGPGDVLVAITEGGETSSVLGTVDQALSNGSDVFLLFNNPADILCQTIERSRNAIEDPRVTVLDLSCGPMALSGSTRMQATTAELLVAGVAMEHACEVALSDTATGKPYTQCVETFEKLLDALESEACVSSMSRWISIEEQVYRQQGLVTYFADELMLDIFTDTTERSPTFMLPPFTKIDDNLSPLPWAVVKNPLLDTVPAWKKVFGREPNCLEWAPELYRKMKMPNELVSNPPEINQEQLYKFMIGGEDDVRRRSKVVNAAISIEWVGEAICGDLKEAFLHSAKDFDRCVRVVIGSGATGDISFPIEIPETSLGLWDRLATKLVLNTVSTGVMVHMGRVRSNWMSCVESTNKKLVDRCVRLISELGRHSYRDACLELFAAKETLARIDPEKRKSLSAVEYVLQKNERPV